MLPGFILILGYVRQKALSCGVVGEVIWFQSTHYLVSQFNNLL